MRERYDWCLVSSYHVFMTEPTVFDRQNSRMSEPSPTVESSLDPIQASRLKPLFGKPVGTLAIHEIYRSLQGESLYAGLPCIFVRLTACHLRCVYCDTPHAFTQGESLTIDEVVAKVLAYNERLVEVTGGEPLLQAEVYPLMTRLLDEGRTVLLETSGAVAIDQVDRRVHVILDVKTPGSGEVAANLPSNFAFLKATDEIKFVVCDRADVDWSFAYIREHQLVGKAATLMSPSFGQVDPTELAAWVLESGLPIRMQLQLHKQLWHPQKRGV
jgi:7-carboxy-7-deazaguanine synthase